MDQQSISVIEKIYEEFSDHLAFREPEVFHYTNLPALHGILEQKALWLTNATMMNDPTEIQYGQSLLSSIYDRFPGYLPLRNKDAKALFELIASTRSRCFLTSFSSKPDLLNQWREYSRHPQGLNIAFSTSELSAFKPDFFLVKVIYNTEVQESILRRAIELLKSDIEKANNSVNLDSFQTTFTVLMHLFQICKHPDYYSEAELRLIHYNQETSHPVQFFNIAGKVKPVVALPLQDPRMHISQIHLAPHGDAELGDIVKLLIDARLKEHRINIQRSRTPIRR